MRRQPKVALIGGGSWATAIAKMLTNNVDELHWWVRSKDIAQHLHLNGQNPRYLSSVHLDPKQLIVDTDLKRVIEQCDIIFMCVPSAYIFS